MPHSASRCETASTRPVPNRLATSRAPGKIILTGEHFVVLGAPAVAMAVNLYSHATVRPARPGRIEVEAGIPLQAIGPVNQNQNQNGRKLLEPLRLAARETLDYIGDKGSGISLDVDCEIPVGAGLGSSASTTVAIITAVAKARRAKLVRKEIFRIAFGPESFLHGSPSGVDHATSIYGGIISFTKPEGIKQLKLKQAPRILVCDTGIHRSTKKLVEAVVRKSREQRQAYSAHVDDVRDISENAIRALRKGDLGELGSLMDANHELLVKIGVSHPLLDKLVRVARVAGALGAKLTGAGGGGCIIALCKTGNDEVSIARALKKHGGLPYRVSMDREGTRIV